MDLPSGPPCKGHGPWQGLLLTASLLTSWNAPTTAQLTIEAVPPSAVEGRDVLLLAHNVPENQQGYRWFRGQGALDSHRIVAYVIATQAMIPGPAYSHRETVYPNGSLLLQNVTQNDTGFYTLQTINPNLESREASGQFHVYPSLLTSWNAPTTAQLTVEAVPPSAVEGRDVLLLAHNLPENQQGYRWFRGQGALDSHRIVAYVIATQAMIPGPAYSHRETVYPNGSLLLQNVTQNDTGFYTLQTINANLESREASGQFHVYPSSIAGCNPPTAAQLAIEAVPSSAVEGRDVLLLVHNLPGNVKGYSWYKGGKGLDSHQIAAYVTDTHRMAPGPAYSGRETIYPNGSLLFHKVTQKDSGFYTLQTVTRDLRANETSGQFHVYPMR